MSNLLIPKPEKREVIAISVPTSTKRLWHELNQQAATQGWDFIGSATEALNVWMRRVKGELCANGKSNNPLPD